MEWNVVIKQSEIVESNVRIGCFNLSVHHYIKCGDTWFASCYGIFDKIELGKMSLKSAQIIAAARLQIKLEEAINVIVKRPEIEK